MSLSPPSTDVTSSGLSAGTDIANTQTGLNTTAALQSQQGSNYNSTNPYESLNYSQTGTGPNGVPIYSASQSLSPVEQGLFNSQTAGQQTAGNEAGSLLSGANYGSTSPADAIGSLTGGLTQQMLGQETSYLDPFFQTQTSQLQSQLANQGIDPNSPAYANAMRQNQTNQGLTVSNFEASALPQTMAQATTEYDQPAQLATELGTYGAPTTTGAAPSTGSALNVTPSNLTSAVSTENTAAQNQYTDEMQQYTNMMNGIFGIGSGVLGSLASGGAFAGV